MKRQHPAWIFLSTVRQLRGLAVPLAILLISGGQRGEGSYLLIAGVLALLGALSRAAAWWKFTYEVTEDELRVRSGLLARQERFLRLERVQSVDINESPLQRLFGVVGVQVETAAGGSATADVTLEAVTRAEAERLRQQLAPGQARNSAAAPATTAEGAVASPTGTLIRRLSPGEVLVAGATSGRIAPALAVFAFAAQLVDDIIPESYWERIVSNSPGFSVRGVIALAAIVAVGAWLLAIGSTALTFSHFELRRDGDRLVIAHGLLERRRRSIPIRRIQAVAVTEGLLRQPLGLATLHFESAGHGTDTAESGVLFPLVRRADLPALLAAACPSFALPLERLALEPPPPRARRRYLMADIWPLLILTGIAVGVGLATAWFRWTWGLLPLALIPLATLHGWRRFQAAGWMIDGSDQLVIRNGGIQRVTTVLPRRRLQRRSLSQNVLQRLAALATFSTAVASGGSGGRVQIDHLDNRVAAELFDRLGGATRQAPPPIPVSAPVSVATHDQEVTTGQ